MLSRKGAGFIGWKGNSKQNLSFYKETCANSAILYRPVKDFSYSFIVLTPLILLSWFQNKVCVTLDWFFSLALMYVAVWSNHVVINFIGNYFETHFCEVFIIKKFSKIGYLVFCYGMRASFNSPYAWLCQTSKFHQQASFVNKIFCICTFCAWVFFSTLLPWEFISVKLRLFLISKRGLVVKFACVT